MKILTLNIKGGGEIEKVAEAIRFARDRRADLLLLCESHITDYKLSLFQNRWKHLGWYTNCQDPNAKGVTIIILNPIIIPLETITVEYKDTDSRILKVSIMAEGKTVRVTGIYAPNNETDNVNFFRKVKALELNGRSDIILGDFNRCEESLDRNPTRAEDRRVREALANLREDRLIDGWRATNPDERQYTFWSNNDLLSASRIDRILVTKKVFNLSSNWQIELCPDWTDHAAVSVEYFPHDRIKTGKGQWYMNTHTFTTEPMIELVANADIRHLKRIESWSQKIDDADPNQGKRYADKIIKRFSRYMTELRSSAMELQKKESLKANKLEQRLRKRICKIDTRERDRRAAQKIRGYKIRLEALLENKARRRVLYTRLKWVDASTGTAEFWSLGQETAIMQRIHALRDDKDKLRKKPQEILNIATEFYKDLYSKRTTYKKDQDRLLNHISPGNFENITGPFSNTEVQKVIRGWNNGKAPGPDGIPYEFFKHFAVKGSLLETALVAVTSILVQPCKYGIIMPEEWALGTIKILWKKGEKEDIKNYRPLSMTNSVFKLFSTLVNNRLVVGFSNCIGTHQVGFMPGRQIYDHVKHVQTVIDYAKISNQPLYIAFLDQLKAYDRVDHDFTWKILDRWGVPQETIEAIRGCYKSAQSTVMVNKFTSEPFPVRSGVRQGDPLSSIIFNAVIETLALELLSANPPLGFLDEAGERHIVDMYADDTACFLTKLSEWDEMQRRYQIYARATGSALNLKKTTILTITDALDTPETYRGIMVIRSERYLGIRVGIDVNYSELWAALHEKIRERIAIWKRWYLSYRQKVSVAATALLSTIWYYLRLIPAKVKDLEPIERTILQFVWGRNSEEKLIGPIKNSHAYRPIELGGLNLISVKTMWKSLALYWIGRMKAAKALPPDQRPSWYTVTCLILTRDTNTQIKPMIEAPWEQIWDVRQKLPPPSVHQFLRHWKAGTAMPPITTVEELAGVEFWFHPLLNKQGRKQRWEAPVWKDLFNGTSLLRPIRTLSQAWDIKIGKVRASVRQRGAVTRLFANLPIEWTTLIEGRTEALPTGTAVESGVYSPYTNSYQTVQMATSNKKLYRHLLKETFGSEDLLSYLKLVCRRDKVSIAQYTERRIWRSIRQTRVDYPKFTDLYWKLILGRVRSGEHWMERPDCPICHVRQSPEHLFWECPAAKAVWERLEIIWEQITGRPLTQKINSWAALLLSGITHSSGTFKRRYIKRRWRILFSEALWTLWVQRCAWSYGEDDVFEVNSLVAKFHARVDTRREMDRLAALRGGSKARQSLEQTWAKLK
jgi:exonuclease III